MAESKVQKVARQTTARKSIGNCQCGGELIWAQVIMTRPRMMKVCEKCGSCTHRSPSSQNNDGGHSGFSFPGLLVRDAK